ncbi:hypothetical protein ECANGB1_1273 [Enterospora canceri]|uniref:Uncharacterized protein n=1 Tax=Enterospora canceri TaxID=1081671 RepID=A0A1Y1S6D9_9MICR|nr:hypothetical protein ECANGB1_1273 [Enterospora canceri]
MAKFDGYCINRILHRNPTIGYSEGIFVFRCLMCYLCIEKVMRNIRHRSSTITTHMLTQCLDLGRYLRPSVKDLLEHPFITGKRLRVIESRMKQLDTKTVR